MIKRHQTDNPNRYVIACPNGRMVVLERIDEAEAGNEALAEQARGGREEGYALFAEMRHNGLGRGDSPGLYLSLLVRPTIPARQAGALSAIAAVAVSRAIERVSNMEARIRWVNDVYYGNHKLAAMMTSARITPNGYLDYAVIGITLALTHEDFQPKLGDVVRQVFAGEAPSLAMRLTETILQEFFLLYDDMMTDHSYMDEYRRRSTVIGKRVRVLSGAKFVRARVLDVDENACLTVELKNGQRMTVSSRSEVVL